MPTTKDTKAKVLRECETAITGMRRHVRKMGETGKWSSDTVSFLNGFLSGIGAAVSRPRMPTEMQCELTNCAMSVVFNFQS